MNVNLLAHTQLVEDIFLYDTTGNNDWTTVGEQFDVADGQQIALTAIRTCYSHQKPSDIVELEGEKYFGNKAKEGKRLFNHIVKSGHTSTLEHVSFTFAIEGVSRTLLAQLTRHRHMSFSVQSQRYVKLSSQSRSGGFDYVVPEKVSEAGTGDLDTWDAFDEFSKTMDLMQIVYNNLIEMGIPQEDARAVLPNAAACNLVLTTNLRTLLDFYKKRKPGNGAQHEITQLALELKKAVVKVEPWTEEFFEGDY